MQASFEILETRRMMAVDPIVRYDVTVVEATMTVRATGEISRMKFGNAFGEPPVYLGVSDNGRIYVNGKRRQGDSLLIGSLAGIQRIDLYGTAGQDIIEFDGVVPGRAPVLSVTTGAGDDYVTISATEPTSVIQRVGINLGRGDDSATVRGTSSTDTDILGVSGYDRVFVSDCRDFRFYDSSGSTFLQTEGRFRGVFSVATADERDQLELGGTIFTRRTHIYTKGGFDTATTTNSVLPLGAVLDLGTDQ